MVEGGSLSAKMARGETSQPSFGSLSESNTLLSRDYAEFRPTGPQKESPTRALSREIDQHKRQVDNQTYLDRAVSFVTEPFHGSSRSLKQMEALAEKAKQGLTDETEKEIKAAISKDQSTLNTQSEFTTYGSSMIETAGLFVGGKKGFAYTALAFAAGSAKPSDPLETRVADMTFGAAKGTATRLLFGAINNSAALDIPKRALLMGGSSRLTDSVLSRKTYYNSSGQLDIAGGAGRIVGNTLSPEHVATDLLVFGGGMAAMQNSAVRNMVEKSPLRATMAAAAAFGWSAGSADEVKRQWTSGESFDFGRIAMRGAMRGAADMVASIPGGMQASRVGAAQRQESLGLARSETPISLAVEPTRAARIIRENIADAKPAIPGSNSREFQIVGGDEGALSSLRGSRSAAAVVNVREVEASSGQVIGPEKRMLIQHVDDTSPIKSRLASTVDLIASCNPQGLCSSLRAKHLFPEGSGSVFMSKLENRLSFGTERPALATAGGAALELGRPMSVSDLLRLPSTKNMNRMPRPFDAYAREMQHFKDPAMRVIEQGADSIVIELADGRILKMTDRPYRKDGQPLWRPEWGFRTVLTPKGTVEFDAKLLTKPQQIEVNNEPLLYYIQERANTPVTLRDLRRFHNMLDRDGHFVFWDGHENALGQGQLGYVRRNGRWQSVLLDYDAVRRPMDVPPDMPSSGSNSDFWMDRYRGDRVDWSVGSAEAYKKGNQR